MCVSLLFQNDCEEYVESWIPCVGQFAYAWFCAAEDAPNVEGGRYNWTRLILRKICKHIKPEDR